MTSKVAYSVEERDDGTLVLKKGDVEVDLGVNNSVFVHTPGDVKVEHTADAVPEIGMVMSDGTIYAGESPTTHQPMYLARPMGDEGRLVRTFNSASEYVKIIQVGEKSIFHLPDAAELQEILNNKECGALKEIFNADANYWSSTQYISIDTHGQHTSGLQDYKGIPIRARTLAVY